MKAALWMSALGLMASAATAQTDQPKQDAVGEALAKLSGHDAKMNVGDLLKSLTVDMPSTTSPATFLLGVAGTAVPRVSTFRAFATQLGRAVDDKGRLRNSMAVEINPRLASGPVSWADFKRSTATQVLTRTTVSAATLASDTDQSARSAFGLQSVLYSAEVPRLIDAASSGPCAAVAPEFAKSTKAGTTSPGTLKPGENLFALPESAQADAKACKERVEGLLTKWNPTALTVGLGQSQFSGDGSVRKLKSGASGAWVTLTLGYDFDKADDKQPKAASERLGFGATLHLRRMVHERATDPADATVQVDESSRLYGLNVRGGNGRLGGLLEYSQRKSKAATLRDENRKRSFAGLEYRISEGLYLSAGVGSETGRRDGKNQRVTLMNLMWGFSGESVLAP